MPVNTDQESLNSQKNAQSENSLGEISQPTDPEIIGSNQSTENMEVHHHPQLHHKAKPWKEYLLGCLMIFVAVSMGFIAENIREGIVHTKKENRQIASFVNALKSDSTQLAFVIEMNDTIIKSIFHFTALREKTIPDKQFKKDFYDNSYVGLTLDIYFKTNDAPLQEMKASGIIGALHHRYIADSIFKYQQNNNIIELQAADCYYLFKESFSLLSNSIDYSNYTDTSNTTVSMGEANVAFMHFKNYEKLEIPNDKKVLKNLYSHAAALGAADYVYINLLKTQLAYNKSLMALLKKEYHLDDK